ncbi:MAG TPA: hypothetical protein VGM15_03125 [Burkholderiaceae bacterium]|jgi:hypothetical protein
MTELTFDAEKHEYRLGPVILPSVTQILAPLYRWAGIPDAVLEYARERGSAVHRACELDDRGILDPRSVDPIVRPYLEAWRAFRHYSGFHAEEIEQPRYSERMGFAGTPDRVGRLTRLRDEPRAVLDIKTSATVGPVHGLQTAGYRWLIDEDGLKTIGLLRYVVQLLANGTYRLHQQQDPLDYSAFLAQLTVGEWQRKHIHD